MIFFGGERKGENSVLFFAMDVFFQTYQMVIRRDGERLKFDDVFIRLAISFSLYEILVPFLFLLFRFESGGHPILEITKTKWKFCVAFASKFY